MTRPRLAHALVASTAAAALAVGGVLVGTAPVSAAPARSDECVAALDALEAEFGDLDFSDEEDLALLEEQLDALQAAFEEAAGPLLDQYEELLARGEALGVDVDSDDLDDAVAGPLTALQDERDALAGRADELETTDIPAAEDAVTDAEAAGADEETLEALRTALDALLAELETVTGDIAVLDEDIAFLQAFPTAVTDLEEQLLPLLEEFAAAFDELLGTVEEVDIERLLELLVAVDLACVAGADDGGAAGGGAAPAPAPAATPVKARASFTG